MRFRHLALLCCCLLLPAAARAQAPRLVRVPLGGAVTLPAVLEQGLDVTRAKDGAWVELLEWPGDGARLAALGATVQVLDVDPGATAAARARAELGARPRGAARAGWLAPVGEGEVGGYWSLAEIRSKLDDLVATDTRDLVADRLDTLGWSLQHRPVLGLEVGRRVTGPDPRPVAFFSALTHAREPEGMQALFWFVDDLLATYDTDPVTRYLLDQRRLYVVPVVNPDGYAFNQRLFDSTAAFGMWRKNLRDTDNSHTTNGGDGVDINRNYGFQWGYDNFGSNGTPSQQTYRGPSAWSEPETRIQRDAIAALRPVTAFSFHTWGDLFIHPWGYIAAGTPDSLQFQTWSDELTRTNGYLSGPAPRVLYSVNGEFSDWMYGDTSLKPKAYSWTPEVGDPDDAFWPPPSRIVPLADEMLRACRTLAGIAGPWVRAGAVGTPAGPLNAGHVASLSVRAEHVGATGTAGPGLTGTLTALDPGAEVLSGPVTYPTLASFASADPSEPFVVAAADTVEPGRLLRFRIDFTDANGLYCRDTIELIVGTPTVLYASGCSSLLGWTTTSPWGVVNNDPAHPNAYLTDSPTGRYATIMDAVAGPAVSFDLSHVRRAWAQWESRWIYESDADGGMFEAKYDAGLWEALPTSATTASAAASVIAGGWPVFEGSRWRWEPDRADLSAWAGGPESDQVWLRFRSYSDPGFQLDGLSVDSLRVLVYDPAAQPAPVAVPTDGASRAFAFAPPAPNPARGPVRFAFELPPGAGAFALEVLDVQGRRVVSYASPGARAGDGAGTSWRWGWDLRDDAGRRVPPGVYLARLRCGAGEIVRRVAVLP